MTQDGKNALADALATKFSHAERHTLLNELGVSPEDVALRARTARDEAWEIVAYFERRDRLERLREKVEEERPGRAAQRSESTATWGGAPAPARSPRRHLAEDRVRDIYNAAIQLGLAAEQDALLSGLPREFAATLPAGGNPGARLWTTLQVLNTTEKLRDGSVPLVAWLAAAHLLRAAHVESRLFEESLAHLAR